MSQKKYKKRHVQSTVAAKKRAAAEELADQKDRARKRLNPTARNLLFCNLILLAVCELMDRAGLIPPLLSGVITIIGIILLLSALWFQFGKGNGDNRHSPLG